MSAIVDGNKLKMAFKEVSNTPADWNATSDPCTPTRWTGIGCNQNNTSVVKVLLNGMDLTGSVAMQELPSSLETLRLGGNQLTGLGRMEALENLPNLVELDISGNQYAGTLSLPENSVKLSAISVSSNKLTSVDWTTFSNKPLSFIDASNNMMVGSIEPQHIRAGNINTFDLSHNRFSGPINWSLFHNFGEIKTLKLHGNHFTGTVSSWEGFESLTVFSVGDNNFTRLTSDEIKSLLKVDGTHIIEANFEKIATGELDFSVITEGREGHHPGESPFLDSINLARNDMTGSLAGGHWSKLWWRSLRELHLSDNMFTGDNPDLSGLDHAHDVEVIALDGNHFTGTVKWPTVWPPSLKQLFIKQRGEGLVYGSNHCIVIDPARVTTDVPICGEVTAAPGAGAGDHQQNKSRLEPVIIVFSVICLVLVLMVAFYCAFAVRKRRARRHILENNEVEMTEPAHLIQNTVDNTEYNR